MKKKILIEVLIVIIPMMIVGALAIPKMLKNFSKMRMITQLKKDFLFCSYTVKDFLRDSGDKTLYNSKTFNKNLDPSVTNLENFVKRYYKVSKMCTAATPGGIKDCIPDSYKGLMDGKEFNHFTGDVCVILKAGTILCFNRISSKGEASKLFMDVNGFEGPNAWGRDAYRFEYDNNGDLDEVEVKRDRATYIFEYCGKDQYGTGCASKIEMDGGTMNY